ncbi:MAG: glutamate synthase-related protein [Candidatus Poribacteria bacterium]|nr:glutamate synthase-related protein [Candidatus Poribacteria bacterium]
MKKIRAVKTINSYLRIPTPKGVARGEFWSPDRIEYMRQLSETGKAAIRSLDDAAQYAANSRSLRDRIRLSPAENGRGERPQPDISVQLNGFNGTKPIPLAAPLVWGDMSFGAIHAEAVKALVRSAEATGILSGTGEGGLHPDIRHLKRFNVQWASARFGVDLETLKSGSAIFIKIGQGAKPGIGGHLPGMKVVGDIPSTRRIPEGRDAISPAPHHDIYSIEDLGQRIWALKLATGQPVYVKVAATNYVPYVACGIARMGGDGVVIDGHLAGTGATPEVIRDNVGIPIEIAVAASDQMLREQMMDGEPLRNRVSIIAGGGVTSSTDMLKLAALGADASMMGTGPLIAMGCVMVHRCHTGKCPTALATQKPHRLLDIDWATERCIQFVNGLKEEIELLLDELGYDSMNQLIGNRNALKAINLNDETLEILGLERAGGRSAPKSRTETDEPTEAPDFWTPWRINHIKANADTGEALITSMGSQSPPFVEPPRVICDWLRSDGAQVTRPSVDPYREEIETSVYLAGGKTRLASPCFFDLSRYDRLEPEAHALIARTASAVGALAVVSMDVMDERIARYGRAVALDLMSEDAPPAGMGEQVAAFLIEDRADRDRLPLRVESLKRAYGKPVFVRTPPIRNIHRRVKRLADAHVDAIIIRDEVNAETGEVVSDLSSDQHYPLEIALSIADMAMRFSENGETAARCRVNLLASSERLRGADDIFKLIALGADAAGIGDAALIAAVGRAGGDLDDEVDFESPDAPIRLENYYWATQKELKLLLGAAGTSSVTTLLGSRELLRSVDLDPNARELLDVKPAGR